MVDIRAQNQSPSQPLAERLLKQNHSRSVIKAPVGLRDERLQAVRAARELWDLAYAAEKGDETARQELTNVMRQIVRGGWNDRELFTYAQLLSSDNLQLTAAEHVDRERTLPSAKEQMKTTLRAQLEGKTIREQNEVLDQFQNAAERMVISILSTVHPTNYRSVLGRRLEERQAQRADAYAQDYGPEAMAEELKASVPDHEGFASVLRPGIDAVWEKTGVRRPEDDEPIGSITPHGKAQATFEDELVTDQEAWEGLATNFGVALEGMIEGLKELKSEYPRLGARLDRIANTLSERREDILQARRWVGVDADGRANSTHETFNAVTNIRTVQSIMEAKGSEYNVTVLPKADMRQNSELHKEALGYLLRYRLAVEGPGGSMADWLTRHGFEPDFDLLTANDPRTQARFYSELINTRHFTLLNGISFDNAEQVQYPLRRIIEEDKRYERDENGAVIMQGGQPVLTADAKGPNFQALVDMRLGEVMECFRRFQAAARVVDDYGKPGAVADRYQIANFATPADYLAVMALMKETGVVKMAYEEIPGQMAPNGRKKYHAHVAHAKLAIQPLFETVADLEAAAETLAYIRGDKPYELDRPSPYSPDNSSASVTLPSSSLVDTLRASKARNTGVPLDEVAENEGLPVMQGYSDSGKNDGYLAAQWNLYKAGQHGRVLHGFGQREARGGAFDVPGLLAQIMNPAIAESGVFDFTVQGHQMVDVASSGQGAQFLASAMTGMMNAMVSAEQGKAPFPYAENSPQHRVMDAMSSMASANYRTLVVNDGEAASAFINGVPGNKSISTRPTIRFSSSKDAWDKNRAIGVEYGGYTGGLPIQMLGVGEALQDVIGRRGGLELLQQMYQESPLNRAIFERMARDLGRNFQPELVREYAATIEASGNPGVRQFAERGIASLEALENALGQIRQRPVERFQEEPRLKEVVGTMGQALRLALTEHRVSTPKAFGAGSLMERALNEATATVVTAYHDPRVEDMAWAHQQSLGGKWQSLEQKAAVTM